MKRMMIIGCLAAAMAGRSAAETPDTKKHDEVLAQLKTLDQFIELIQNKDTNDAAIATWIKAHTAFFTSTHLAALASLNAAALKELHTGLRALWPAMKLSVHYRIALIESTSEGFHDAIGKLLASPGSSREGGESYEGLHMLRHLHAPEYEERRAKVLEGWWPAFDWDADEQLLTWRDPLTEKTVHATFEGEVILRSNQPSQEKVAGGVAPKGLKVKPQQKVPQALTRPGIVAGPNVFAARRLMGIIPIGANTPEGRLGLSVRTLEDDERTALGEHQQGVYVGSVEKGRPADDASLRVGDIITKVGDTPVSSPENFKNALSDHYLDERLTFTVLRDKKLKTLRFEIE